jgi:hypothetical protein
MECTRRRGERGETVIKQQTFKYEYHEWVIFWRDRLDFCSQTIHQIGSFNDAGDAVGFQGVLVEELLDESDVRARVKRATKVGQVRINLSDQQARMRLSTALVIPAKMLQQMFSTFIIPTADGTTDSPR